MSGYRGKGQPVLFRPPGKGSPHLPRFCDRCGLPVRTFQQWFEQECFAIPQGHQVTGWEKLPMETEGCMVRVGDWIISFCVACGAHTELDPKDHLCVSCWDKQANLMDQRTHQAKKRMTP